MCYDTYNAMRGGMTDMDIAKKITELREETGENRKEFRLIRGYLSVLWRTGRRADELRQNMSRG